MKKTVPFIKAFVLCAALLTSFAVLSADPVPAKEPPVTENSTGIISYSAEKSYTVREYNGRIAVFEDSIPEPYEVFDIFVLSLPEEDRALLAEGISAKSPEELQKLLEDYTG